MHLDLCSFASSWLFFVVVVVVVTLLLLLLLSVVAVQLAKVGSVDRVHSDLRRWHALAAPQGRDACAERYRLWRAFTSHGTLWLEAWAPTDMGMSDGFEDG